MRFYTSAVVSGEHVLLREVHEGHRIKERVAYEPTLFEIARGPTDSDYTTIHGEIVDPIKYSSMKAARDSSVPTHGMTRFVYPFLNETYPGRVDYDIDHIVIAYIDIECESDAGVPDPFVADRPITAISMKTRDEMHTFGTRKHTPTDSDVTYHWCKNEIDLLQRFLSKWEEVQPDVVTGWNIDGFDIPFIMTRISRLIGVEATRRLSPWKLKPKTIDRATSRAEFVKVYVIKGVATLDYMRLFKNKNLVPAPYESYSLNAICAVELGEQKLDYSEYQNLLDLYRRDFDKFVLYNQRDIRLIEKLEEKRGLIALVLAMAYRAKVNYEDVLASSRPWDAMTHNYLSDRKIVVPLSSKSEHTRMLLGGYVKKVVPGLYSWVGSFDVAAEYPNTIIGCNISPETYLGKIPELDLLNFLPYLGIGGDASGEQDVMLADWHQKLLGGALDAYRDMIVENDAIITANGCLYSRAKRGFLPTLLASFFDERQEYKRLSLEAQREFERTRDPALKITASRFDTLQMAAKISTNAAYGCLSNAYYRWHSIDLAESITSTGQLTIKWAERTINDYMNRVLDTRDVDYVIACDTDSTYVNFGPLVERAFGTTDVPIEKGVDFIDAVCREKIQPLLDAAFTDLARRLNVPENRITMKREVIADRGVWTAAKNYILNVHDEEGVRFREPKLKVVGIKAAKPSTPQACREKIGEAFRLLVRGDRPALMDFIERFERDFDALTFEDIAFTRSISGLKKYTENPKGTPIQVKGALLYNRLVSMHAVKTAPPIQDGDRARFCYLRMPNPTMQHVITAPHGLPDQFGLEPYLDKQKQFEKAFLDPLYAIMTAIGWHHEKASNLGELFG